MDDTEADYQFFTRLVGTFTTASSESPDSALPKSNSTEVSASLSELRARLQAQLDKSRERRQGKNKKVT